MSNRQLNKIFESLSTDVFNSLNDLNLDPRTRNQRIQESISHYLLQVLLSVEDRDNVLLRSLFPPVPEACAGCAKRLYCQNCLSRDDSGSNRDPKSSNGCGKKL